jgi:hypothetical protein
MPVVQCGSAQVPGAAQGLRVRVAVRWVRCRVGDWAVDLPGFLPCSGNGAVRAA